MTMANTSHNSTRAPLLAAPQFALAQDDAEAPGRVWGDYTVQQSVELGGRVANVSGNQQLYGTLVNLKSGPRLLGEELSMHSISHTGGLFDNLYLSSFGFGRSEEHTSE